MMKQFLSLFVLTLTIGSSLSATLSKTNAAQRRAPFFGTKGGQLQEQPQEEEAALPGFVEPPAAPVPEPDAGQPMMPYEFEYSAPATGGSSARRESNDGQRVTGTYTLAGPDGISRVVHYVADKDGFRATIITNEPGTESQAPSGVILNSSQLPAEQIALQYGPREPERPVGPVILAPIPAIPAFAPARLVPLAPLQFSGALVQTPAATQTTALPTTPAAPSSRSAQLLAAAGIKGSAPIIQQRLSPVQARKTAPVKAAPIVQQRQEAVKAAPIVQQRQEAVKAAPIVQQRQEAIKAPPRPSAPIKAAPIVQRPAPPPPAIPARPVLAPIKGKTAPRPPPARLTKTAPIKSAQRQPFYATLPPPPPPPPAPTTIAQQLDQLVQQQDEQQEAQPAPQQELEQLRQEPQQQQQQLDQQQDDAAADSAGDQEAENLNTENTFFA